MTFEKVASEAASKISNATYGSSEPKSQAAIAAAILAHAFAMKDVAEALRSR